MLRRIGIALLVALGLMVQVSAIHDMAEGASWDAYMQDAK